MYCMQCGQEISETAKFCQSCGASQEVSEADEPISAKKPVNEVLPETTTNEQHIPKAKGEGGNLLLKMVVFSILVVLLVTNFDKLKLIDSDHKALADFKNSVDGQSLYKCVGANGGIEWEIFKSDNTGVDVRVIQAHLSKGSEKFEIQFFYNLETKVAEVAFMSKDGEPKSKFKGALEFTSFCM